MSPPEFAIDGLTCQIRQVRKKATLTDRPCIEGLAFRLSGLVANPLESPGGDQADNQKVVAAEACGILPGFAVFVGPLEGDVEHLAFIRLLAPDAGADDTVADFVDGLSV